MGEWKARGLSQKLAGAPALSIKLGAALSVSPESLLCCLAVTPAELALSLWDSVNTRGRGPGGAGAGAGAEFLTWFRAEGSQSLSLATKGNLT